MKDFTTRLLALATRGGCAVHQFESGPTATGSSQVQVGRAANAAGSTSDICKVSVANIFHQRGHCAKPRVRRLRFVSRLVSETIILAMTLQIAEVTSP